MKTIIRRWGNSLAVRLPKALCDDAKIGEGIEVELSQTDDGLLLKRAAKRRYRLSDLVAGITRKNLHSETAWGPAQAREILE